MIKNLLVALSIGIPASLGTAAVLEGTIDAPVAEVWKVFTTSEGYKALGVAQAEVDFRVGGLIRSHYAADGVLGDDQTIENQFMAFEPLRMIAFRIHKPPAGFPFKEAWKHSWTVLTFIDLGEERTQLRIAGVGVGTDDESVAMDAFFEQGNRWTLQTLQAHFRRP